MMEFYLHNVRDQCYVKYEVAVRFVNGELLTIHH